MSADPVDQVNPGTLFDVAQALAPTNTDTPHVDALTLQRAVASVMTCDEVGPEPARGDYATRSAYETALDRFVVEQNRVFAEMCEIVARVAAAFGEVARIESQQVPLAR